MYPTLLVRLCDLVALLAFWLKTFLPLWNLQYNIWRDWIWYPFPNQRGKIFHRLNNSESIESITDKTLLIIGWRLLIVCNFLTCFRVICRFYLTFLKCILKTFYRKIRQFLLHLKIYVYTNIYRIITVCTEEKNYTMLHQDRKFIYWR